MNGFEIGTTDKDKAAQVVNSPEREQSNGFVEM